MVEWRDKPLNKICDKHTSGALHFSSGFLVFKKNELSSEVLNM